jgi:sterol desaturase/sphingolipid hydroxylase (fatty acid hydroxylase superfamily)
MHKIHHSRVASETDTNYGNILALFDRLFGTFTPTSRAPNVDSGLDGHDDIDGQGFVALLALPFRSAANPIDPSLRVDRVG